MTSQRTGSTLLARSLDLSPDIVCAGEIFLRARGAHRPEFQYPYRVLGSLVLGRFRDRIFPSVSKQHLKSFFCGASQEGVSAVGFKLMISQLDRMPYLMGYLLEMDTLPIFLIREDDRATALSYHTAQSSGIYHQTSRVLQGSSKGLQPLDQLMQSCAAYRIRLESMHRVHGGLLLHYESLVADWHSNIARIGQYLGLSDLKVPMAMEKL